MANSDLFSRAPVALLFPSFCCLFVICRPFHHHFRASVHCSCVTPWTQVQMMTSSREANQLPLFVNFAFLERMRLSVTHLLNFFSFLHVRLFPWSPPCSFLLWLPWMSSLVSSHMLRGGEWSRCLHYWVILRPPLQIPHAVIYKMGPLLTRQILFLLWFLIRTRHSARPRVGKKVLRGFLPSFGSTGASSERAADFGRVCKWLPWRHLCVACFSVRGFNVTCMYEVQKTSKVFSIKAAVERLCLFSTFETVLN